MPAGCPPMDMENQQRESSLEEEAMPDHRPEQEEAGAATVAEPPSVQKVTAVRSVLLVALRARSQLLERYMMKDIYKIFLFAKWKDTVQKILDQNISTQPDRERRPARVFPSVRRVDLNPSATHA